MELVYRSNDGKEFKTPEECEVYERRLYGLVNEFVNMGDNEKVPGSWIADKIGVDRKFLPVIYLMDNTLEIVERLEGARHVAEHLDSYIKLGKWLASVESTLHGPR